VDAKGRDEDARFDDNQMTTLAGRAEQRSLQRVFLQSAVALVSQDSAACDALADLLVGAGFSVSRYRDRDDAIKSLECDETDLLIVDLYHDSEQCFDVSQELVGKCKQRDIPLVFLGPAAETEMRLESLRRGGVDYIGFPFLDDEVIARLHNYIAMFSIRRELKSVQEELRLSKNSLKLAHEIARLGHWEWEMENDVVRWSDEASAILGLAPHDCRPSVEILFQRVHPEEREAVTEHFSHIPKSGNFDLEFRVLLPDGRIRMLHGRGQLACLVDCRYPHIIDDADHHGQGEQVIFIGVLQDVTERKALEQKLEVEAHTDALTGCASRRYFLELAQRSMDQLREQGEAMSLLMLDLDNFKHINDRYGHQVGDLTLQTLVEVCSQQLRNEDVIGRLGGEEFAVLLPRTRSGIAMHIAERLRKTIEQAVVPYGEGVPFTASIGVAELCADDVVIDALLYRADRALYAAKEGGRNRVCLDE